MSKTMKAVSSKVSSTSSRAAKEGQLDGPYLTSAQFERKAYAREWLIESILLPEQPAILGGPKKSLKTSLAVDLAISLGTGTQFLGRFAVPRSVRVAVFSGESGEAVLQETALRIAESKEVELSQADVYWSFNLPRLGRKADLERLQAFLKEQAIKVVIVDPLYLSLFDGVGSRSASNLFEMGPLLRKAAQACLLAGATPIFVHHTTKRAAYCSTRGAIDLNDLAFAGIAEFARQWLLVNRRERYRQGSGQHALTLWAEGSAGHSAHWQVDIREGSLDAEFATRQWQVAVRDACQEVRAKGLSKQKSKVTKHSIHGDEANDIA